MHKVLPESKKKTWKLYQGAGIGKGKTLYTGKYNIEQFHEIVQKCQKSSRLSETVGKSYATLDKNSKNINCCGWTVTK